MANLKQRVVFYHAGCRDGFGAAWAARRHFGDEADYVPFSHGEKVPELQPESDVWFVDICPRGEAIGDLLGAGHTVTILDHHVTTEEQVEGLTHDRLKVVYRTDQSGAVITWNHFFPEEKLPKLLAHIQDRDLWEWNYPDTGPITEALNAVDHDFVLWDRLTKYPEALRDLRDSGHMLVALKKKTVQLVLKRSYIGVVGGHKVPMVNSDSYMSEVGHALVEAHPECPFSAVWVVRADGTRKFSLRSTDEGMDVSKVAEQFGGGGHRAAAGFVVP